MGSRIELVRLRVLGKDKPPIDLHFKSGLNVIRGSSNSGKTHAVRLIDYAFGASTHPYMPSEADGRDSVLLTIKLPDGKIETLCRTVAGGDVRVVDGVPEQFPSKNIGTLYKTTHGTKGQSISEHLLKALGSEKIRVKYRASGDTKNLTFRDLMHHAIVQETRILSELSPIEFGQHNERPREFSIFKYLLTGVDDSSLDSTVEPKKEREKKALKLESIDTEIAEVENRIKDFTLDELEEQKLNLASNYDESFKKFQEPANEYSELVLTRSSLANRLDQHNEHLKELRLLIKRFRLLEQHYHSDVKRLESLIEASSYFLALDAGDCPLCGTPGQQHKSNEHSHLSEADIQSIIDSAAAEIEKIKMRLGELQVTINGYSEEAVMLPAQIENLSVTLNTVNHQIQQKSPDIKSAQERLRGLFTEREALQEKLYYFSRLNMLKKQRLQITGAENSDVTSFLVEDTLDGKIRTDFENIIEEIIKGWGLSEGKVVFDKKVRDIEIDGKPRKNNGKGMRAILYSAFCIALITYCIKNHKPHPGFLILDTPLLTYKDPEPGTEDVDLAQSDLKSRMFNWFKNWGDDKQIIIVENVDVPDWIESEERLTIFTGRSGSGRKGFY